MDATFSFVDLAGFSALTEAHGDIAAADLAERFASLVAAALPAEGRLVKMIGDAALVTLPTPALAVGFIRRLVDRVCEEPDFPICRAGLHHGEAVERAGDVFGTAVNLAARIAAQARGGQVLATAAVAEAARAAGLGILPLGPVRLHNLRDAVDLFAIELTGHGDEVIDPVCRMRVRPEQAAGHLRAEGASYWFCSLRCAGLFAGDPGAYRSRPYSE